MGVNLSSIKAIKQNEYLLKVVGTKHIDSADSQFWNEFLSSAWHNIDEICSDVKFAEENVVPLLSQWTDNNLSSNNLGSFIRVFTDKIEILKKESFTSANYNIIVWHSYNLLFIMRTMFKYLIETINEDNLMKHCKTEEKNGDDNGNVMMENFINTLIEVLVDVELNNATYHLHLEACKTFLVLLAIQMFSAKSSRAQIYSMVMHKKCSIHALLLTKRLLTNFINQDPAPTTEGGSLIFGLASGLWNVITLGYGNKKSDEDMIKEAVLARHCLLLLLVLTNHCTKEANPYREALFQCSNSENDIYSEHNLTGFKVEFSKLYRTLCTTLNDDQTTLLLYMLLHQNQHFKTFVLSRTTDLDQFVIPVLRILYHSPDRNSHHIYMALIILLVLSEDNLFNNTIHDITLRNISWYTERNLSEISLGGLIILVIARTIHFNMSRGRDRFLHTNLCATLANMSNYFKYLSTYVCEKLVNLFEKLSKKYLKILNQIEMSKLNTPNGNSQSVKVGGDTGSETINTELIDLPIFEEVLRTILEIINACLSKNLANNTNLVYTLLYKRKVFEPFFSNPALQDIVINIETVLTYFTNRIEATERTLSVDEVFEIIKHSSLQWPSEKLKKFPELRFRYVEDEQPEDFFIPYIWSLVFRSSNLFWSSENILLFNPVRNN